MSRRSKDNTVGPWAQEKLEALDRALDYYTTYLKNQVHWQKIYIDAFAGPGLSEVRRRPKDDQQAASSTMNDLFAPLEMSEIPDPVEEEVRYLQGSPRVALGLRNLFDRYIFIERAPERLADLELLRADYSVSRNVEIIPGDANAALLGLLASGFSKRTHRAYVFLDPFGIQVPWSTIEALARTGAIEVMINFPLGMAIRRMLPRHGDVPEGWSTSLTAFFGSVEWREHTYTGEINLAGDAIKRQDSEVRLLAWYRERLRLAFGFVSEAQLVTNTRGSHLYYLIWAGPREEGLKGANHILTMKARGGPKRHR